jgi:two-component system KDP operon response regulator KdpE
MPTYRARDLGRYFVLAQTEFRFLLTLAPHAALLVLQVKLIEVVWGPSHGGDTHYLRVLVSRLRKKVLAAGVAAKIQTEAGLGYRLNSE